MIALRDFCVYLDLFLKSGEFTDFCQNGLQVQGRDAIQKIATGVTATLSTIEEAVKRNVNVLIVHHGLFWQRDPYAITGTKYQKIKLLIENGISLMAYHLPLDANIEVGNNWVAARELGWTDLEPFGYANQIPIGVKGRFSPMSRDDFKRQLEGYYQHPAHTALGGKEVVQSAALVSGGAYKEISQAIKAGVDCFITGNFDEPVWHQAFEERMNFFALGHSATERVGPRALGKHLQGHFGIECEFIDLENPF